MVYLLIQHLSIKFTIGQGVLKHVQLFILTSGYLLLCAPLQLHIGLRVEFPVWRHTTISDGFPLSPWVKSHCKTSCDIVSYYLCPTNLHQTYGNILIGSPLDYSCCNSPHCCSVSPPSWAFPTNVCVQHLLLSSFVQWTVSLALARECPSSVKWPEIQDQLSSGTRKQARYINSYLLDSALLKFMATPAMYWMHQAATQALWLIM